MASPNANQDAENDGENAQTLFLSQNASMGNNYLSTSVGLHRTREPLREIPVSGPNFSPRTQRPAKADPTLQRSPKSHSAPDTLFCPKAALVSVSNDVENLSKESEKSSDSDSLVVAESTLRNERVEEHTSTGSPDKNVARSDDSGSKDESGIDPWQSDYEPERGPLLCHWSAICSTFRKKKMLFMT